MVRLIGNFFVNWLNKEKEPTNFPLCDFERLRYEIRPCDVLLIEGRSRISEVIKSITQSPWSHAALYIGRLHNIEDPLTREIASKYLDSPLDTQFVIEGILGQGTVISPINVYKDDHIRICRPKGLSPDDANKIIEHAVKKLGTNYDVRNILDLARLLLPWSILPKKWRSEIFATNPGVPTKTVCSSLIASAFSNIDFPILPYVKSQSSNDQTKVEFIKRNPRLYTPKDFDYSPFFEIIKYPFVQFDNALYKKLPWNKEGIISNDNEHFSKKDTKEE